MSAAFDKQVLDAICLEHARAGGGHVDSGAVRLALGCKAPDLRAAVQRLRWAGKIKFDRLEPSASVVEARMHRTGERQRQEKNPARPAAVIEAGRVASPAIRPAALPRPLSATLTAAARIDGRPLPAFLAAIVALGLDCWRDDRLANGEAVDAGANERGS